MRHVIWEGDTKFGHYVILDASYDGRPARVLYSGDRQAAQSGIATDDEPDLLFDYNQRLFELVSSVAPSSVLLIGGGVFTLPTALLAALPDLRIDVVEPDHELTKLARNYFYLPEAERLRIFNTDGRTFLREQVTRYDMVLVDAFTHTTIPNELRTLQAFKAFYAHLHTKGMLAMNVISAYHGRGSATLEQLCAAASRMFKPIDIFLAARGYSLWLPQNFVLTAQKGQNLPLKDYVRHDAVDPLQITPDMILNDEN